MAANQTFVGFDSAWTDNAKAPGAICAVQLGNDAPRFHPPRLVSFAEALTFVEEVASDYTLVALDQPTIVPNLTSMRPAERVAVSAISWMGGGVQPANRGKVGMFCDASPIWPFLRALGATEDPIAAREAKAGRHLFECWGIGEAVEWCRTAGEMDTPRKADQDRLDAMLCLAMALHWRLEPAEASIMLGDTSNGYIVAPASPELRLRLTAAAARVVVPVQ